MSANAPSSPALLLSGALKGFANGSSYDKHRPSYPAAAVDFLLDQLGLLAGSSSRHDAAGGSRVVVDLAAGTGKFTELLAARPEAYEVVAVEPHDGMRSELDAKSLRNVVVKRGFATEIPLEDGVADGLVCAQSFHWFARSEALASIARVLKPKAGLALIWNIEDYNNTLSHVSPHPWTLRLRELLFRLDKQSPPDTPALRFRNETWRHVFVSSSSDSEDGSNTSTATSNTTTFFENIQEREFPWTTWLDREALWNRFATLSQIAALQDSELADARKLFDDALDVAGTEVNECGEIAVRGSTLVVWTRRK